MELKTARFTLLMDPNKKVAFERLCALQDLTPSQVVRQLIRDYMAQHGVSYIGSGTAADVTASAGVAVPAPPGRPAVRRSLRPSARKASTRKKA